MRLGIRLFIELSALLLGATPVGAAEAMPAPSSCAYLQPEVKACTVSTTGGLGTFEVSVAPPASLVITFEDAVTGMQPPPASSYRASFVGSTATVVPIRRDPEPGATVHFDTTNVHVTLHLRVGRTPDTQLLVVDPRKGAGNDEAERRVKERLEDAAVRANAESDERLLGDVAAFVAVTPVDSVPTRHNQVVLRARSLVRLGSRRVLTISVENRSAEELEVRGVRIFSGPEGKRREVSGAAFRAVPKTLKVGGESVIAVFLPTEAGELTSVRVEFTNREHDLELAGIRLKGGGL